MSALDDVVAVIAAQTVLDQTQQEAALAVLLGKLNDLLVQLDGYFSDAFLAGTLEKRIRGVVLEGGVACPAETLTFDVKVWSGVYVFFEPVIYGENLYVTVKGRSEVAKFYLNNGDWWAEYTGGEALLTEDLMGVILGEALEGMGVI